MKTVGFIICSLIGYTLGHYLPIGQFSTYASVLISYHLYLCFLVLIAEHETGFSLPFFSTLFTHLAFLTVLICFSWGRNHIPFFAVLRLLVPGLAPFETQWLFSGGRKKTKAVDLASLPQEETDEYEEFLNYLGNGGRRTFKRPGMSVREEHALWLADRAKKRTKRADLIASLNQQE